MLSVLIYRPLMHFHLKMLDVLTGILPDVAYYHYDAACWCYEKIWGEPFEPYEE